MKFLGQRYIRVLIAMVWWGLASQSVAADLRLLAYNIHHGEGLDGKIDLERIAKLITDHNPDVVALQEVDQGCRRTGNVKQADELARLTGMHSFFAKFMDFQGGTYGMAILTRLPVVEERRVELPEGTEPRASAVVTVRTEQGPVTVADIHFYQTAAQRLAQAKALAEALEPVPHPVVWIGDFNSSRGDAVMGHLAVKYAVPIKQGSPNTFPADHPRREIDFVIFTPPNAFKVKEYKVVEETVISDHRPIWVVLSPED